ncbi:MAG: terminase large subunit domain-containing protein, partial [Pseudonocardiaceae bacterium]
MPRTIHALVADAERQYGPEGTARLAARIKAQTLRLRTARECPTALALAQRFDPSIVRTPAMDLLDHRLHECLHSPSGRLILSIAPQAGKTTLARWAILRALIEDPERRIVLASYAVSLARSSGRLVRGLVETHGPGIGLSVDREHRDAADWQLEGHIGGLYVCGVGGALTGKAADCLVVDDALRGHQDADSDTIRGNLHDWWESVARTRLAPGAPVVVIGTRWHADDLSGRLEGQGWPVVNIPALADGKVPDALNRPVGEWLRSTRGTTVPEWEATRRDVGERVFAALYQGVPSPPGGGIFLQEWFDRDRVECRPPGSPPVVVVDPADNVGTGDEAGIIVMSTDAQQRIYLGPDYSGHYTTARWVRVALLAVVRHQGAALAYEQSLSGLDRSVRDGWRSLHKQAKILKRLGAVPAGPVEMGVVEQAATELAHPDDPPDTWDQYRLELVELWPLVDAVLGYPSTGPSIRRIIAKGSKQLRAQLVAPLYENRRVSHVGHLPELEFQQTTWQPGQDSPDRMDCAIHALGLGSGATVAVLSSPSGKGELPTRSTRNPSHRGGALPRSTSVR